MGFTLEHAFAVKAPPTRVWAFLTDPYRVAPALPGASITSKLDEASYGGAITIKVGPVTARYQGTLRFEELDAAARSARIVARGKETSGRGGADLKMTSVLTEESTGDTRVNITSEVNVTGALAQFGRGLIQDVSNQMFQRFTESVRKELEAPISAPEVPAQGAVAVDPSSNDGPGANGRAEASGHREAAALDVLSLGGKVLEQRARHALRKPRFWIAIAIVLLLIYWLATR